MRYSDNVSKRVYKTTKHYLTTELSSDLTAD